MTVGELSTIWSQHPDLMYIKEVEGRPDTSHREVNSKRDRQTDPHLSHIFFTMATRSRIGIELQDGSILSSYHHYDGYPSWLGRILETHYNTKEEVSSLIDGGDMSSCWSDTVWGQERTDGNKYGPEYYSARGENCPPRYDKDMEEFFSMGEEYSYIFRNGNWFAYDMHEFDDTVAPEPVEIPAGALAV